MDKKKCIHTILQLLMTEKRPKSPVNQIVMSGIPSFIKKSMVFPIQQTLFICQFSQIPGFLTTFLFFSIRIWIYLGKMSFIDVLKSISYSHIIIPYMVCQLQSYNFTQSELICPLFSIHIFSAYMFFIRFRCRDNNICFHTSVNRYSQEPAGIPDNQPGQNHLFAHGLFSLYRINRRIHKLFSEFFIFQADRGQSGVAYICYKSVIKADH